MTEEPVEILLVEDNASDLELTLHALKRHRLANRIEIVRDGQEALDYLFAAHRQPNIPPKVILLDLKLPKVDGLDVLRAIKANPATRAIPVIVLTSSREESDMVEAYKLGVNSYVVKPVDFEQFTEAVRILGMYWLLLNKLPRLTGEGKPI